MRKVPSWYSLAKPKPVYEWDDIQAFAGVPVFAEHEEVRFHFISVLLKAISLVL